MIAHRRTVVLLTLLAVVLAKPTAHAQEQEHAEPRSKKDQALEEKNTAQAKSSGSVDAWRKQLKRRIGKKPSPAVNLYNKWTHEYLVFDKGDTQPPPPAVANQFLRCHFTNQPTDMDQRLVSVLLEAAKKFRVHRVDVVSGFRDPKYNLTLRKKGRQVARNSEHTLGHAVDFRLPGVGIKRLHAWARSLRLGGVGFYHRSQFIHVDVGRVRYWNGT